MFRIANFRRRFPDLQGPQAAADVQRRIVDPRKRNLFPYCPNHLLYLHLKTIPIPSLANSVDYLSRLP